MATTRIYEDHTDELLLTVRPGRGNKPTRKRVTLQVDGSAGRSLTRIRDGKFSFELTTKQALELGAMLLQAKIDDLGRRGLHTLLNAAKNAKRPTGE